MLISEFDYELPDRLIAQEPLENRSASRMLFVDRSTSRFDDETFAAFPEHLREGDVVVLNNTKVFPARLIGRSATGAKVELFLVCPLKDGHWETLARPARRLKTGKLIDFGPQLSAEVLSRNDEGRVTVRFDVDGDLETVIDAVGRTPLPPYIKRDENAIDDDRQRYQTVFASRRGAIAAPTAGLHFTPGMIDSVLERGASVVEITLHVGYGTFEPVRVEDLGEHRVMPERYEIDEAAADILNTARNVGRRIIAIGTTTTRALESSIQRNGRFTAEAAQAELTITPGYRFAAVNAMLTNFHLPRSSLLVLVSTFAGHELIMNAYRHAVSADYRFYSYGDCMFIG